MGIVRVSYLGIVLVSLLAAPTLALDRIIDFEDQPPVNDSRLLIGEEYARLGAHFIASNDGATWAGIGAGDPGNWQIEGTQGSSFLGFDGPSHSMSLLFDAPVEAFQIDVSRAEGPRFQFDWFEVTGFLDGQKVESRAAFFAATNRWQTVALSGPVDHVIWFGTGRRGHRYGVDNLQWVEPGPESIEVEIDVRPGDEDNRVKLGSKGVVPVVLYGELDFAVEDVDLETLAFGPDAAGPAHRKGPHFGHIDDDDLLDMVLHHRVVDTGITADDSEACLTGETLDGARFQGCDLVTPLSKPRKSKLRKPKPRKPRSKHRGD